MPDEQLHEGRSLSADEWRREALARAVRSHARRADADTRRERGTLLPRGTAALTLLLVVLVAAALIAGALTGLGR